MFEKFPSEQKEYYRKMLIALGSLSKLFSDSDIPYLDYRIAENLYCKSFNSKNVSRDDSSVDAVFGRTGVGIKTFQGNSLQKIAEFNKALQTFQSLHGLEKVKRIAELRNERLLATDRIYGLKQKIYHCIRRESGKIVITEEDMDSIDIQKIELTATKANSLSFKDEKNKYIFNASKSVLLKRFSERATPVLTIGVPIIEDPFELVEKHISGLGLAPSLHETHERVLLPLYSLKNGIPMVHEKSGLNQWNARGRPRDLGEVYIPVPAKIHKEHPGFFPPRDVDFRLILPNKSTLKAKICQDGSKALMTNPNKALGEWILRDVLLLKEGELLTYEKLLHIGIDTVEITKISGNLYEIEFLQSDVAENLELG